MRLEGRKVLITGAASGIGHAIAQRFAQEGANLFLTDLAEEAVTGAASKLPRAAACRCDVSRQGDVKAAASSAIQYLGGLDGVVNAAGVDLVQPFGAMSDEQWERIIAVNLTGAMRICQAGLNSLLQAPFSTIVNIASAAGLSPLTERTAYCASKAGLVMFSKALALEFAKTSLRVNVICPGAIDTPMLRSSYETAPDASAAYAKLITRMATGRVGSPDDIAAAALYLTSTDAAYVTGTALSVDGGRVFH